MWLKHALTATVTGTYGVANSCHVGRNLEDQINLFRGSTGTRTRDLRLTR